MADEKPLAGDYPLQPNEFVSNHAPGRYPLLEALLAAKGLIDKGTWTIGDVAHLFNVRKRAMYDRIANGKLVPRDLPGHNKFLSEDLEEFLRTSKVSGRRNARRRQR